MKYTRNNIDGVKFKTSSTTTTIYTISDIRDNGTIRCTLTDQKGVIANSNYNAETVIEHLNSGYWKPQIEVYEIY